MLSRVRQWFGTLLKRSAPIANQPPAGVGGNQRLGTRFRLSVKGPAGQRDEEINLVSVLSGVFTRLGREHSARDSVLTDTLSGITFRPELVSFQPCDDLSMWTSTTIEIGHATKLPSTFFEYQHSIGASGALSFAKGFEDWAQLDLPVVLDALSPEPKSCTVMEFEFQNRKSRRVLLGPVSLLAPKREEPISNNPKAHPPFCPCCLFSHSVEAFKPLVDSGGFAAVRLYATRTDEGAVQADCRVNGEDFPAGADALIAYARTWPGLSFEARKQYIIIQDKPEAVTPSK
jgi:hypothetical protein